MMHKIAWMYKAHLMRVIKNRGAASTRRFYHMMEYVCLFPRRTEPMGDKPFGIAYWVKKEK